MFKEGGGGIRVEHCILPQSVSGLCVAFFQSGEVLQLLKGSRFRMSGVQ